MQAVNKRDKQSGVSLIEVLVTVLILAIGLLGVASLQSLSLKGGTQSFLNSRAQMVTSDLVDRMMANMDSAVDGDYAGTPVAAEPTPNCHTASCSGAQMAAHDLWQVSDRMTNEMLLLRGALSVAYDAATREYSIAITWDAAVGGGASGGSYTASTCTAADNNNSGCMFTAVRF
ncbi:type IV pilus modification protein PilV [Alkalimarinus alittae]|uniref:Type IV pilus modification protein PilV n=1 Tax=Alkalimarinus alittae TaxID=2961619 RepID=A0ABY6N0H9_9ALTE|nr:type IV pilus modification protein PilV [Alkalimarinus alittae]UZE95603.1 type IV pilus modification protein PilV [Alkalimarinus alittae]